MSNPFVHLELYTSDLAKAKGFYGKLFGWKLSDMPNPAAGESGTYTMIDVGGGTGGGMLQNQRPGGSHWLAYVGVEDIAEFALWQPRPKQGQQQQQTSRK